MAEKRPRDDAEEGDEVASKRLQRWEGEAEEDEGECCSSSCRSLPQILQLEDEEGEEDEGCIQQEDEGLVTDVMRSLEKELAGGGSSSGCEKSDSQSPSPSPSSSSRLDLGFLLEASDDELGIEPSSDCGGEEAAALAVVEADDLVRGDSWSDGDWPAACGLEEEQQQEWLRRSIEVFMSSCSSSSQPAFEAAAPVLIEL